MGQERAEGKPLLDVTVTTAVSRVPAARQALHQALYLRNIFVSTVFHGR